MKEQTLWPYRAKDWKSYAHARTQACDHTCRARHIVCACMYMWTPRHM